MGDTTETLTPAELLARKRIERQRFAAIDAGVVAHHWLPRPPQIRILMVVDSGISFNQFYFGLSEVLDTLRTAPEGFASFRVTKVHRFNDPNPPADVTLYPYYKPNAENFRFDVPPTLKTWAADGTVASQKPFDIDDFHQVWFYGFNSSQNATPTPAGSPPPPALTDAELAILFRWMDEKNGGVFATGDHETLGAALCSRIPRVRSMRRWTDNPPPVGGTTRHDTSRGGHDRPETPEDESTLFTFDDESDDIPQRIALTPYYRFLGRGRIMKAVHPILCGTTTRGAINVLPDHPHEGEVVKPSDLGKSYTFGSYTAAEYPLRPNGTPLSPDVIAKAHILSAIDDSNSFKGDVVSKDFGVIGAYNGHRVGVGRVVTDSTWHHWFDVNLTGRMVFGSDVPGSIESGDMRKLKGFLDTPAGLTALAKIRNYFRNVAIWLAPPAQQKAMVKAALWRAVWRYPLIEEALPGLSTAALGKLSYDALTHLYGPCAVTWWMPIIVKDFPMPEATIPLPEPDPEPFGRSRLTLRTVEESMLGGIVQQLAVLRDDALQGGQKIAEEKLDAAIEEGTRAGLHDLRRAFELQKVEPALERWLAPALGLRAG